ncbi:MAG TPA: type IV toxin-antitoxin system AbiEi family antitoxin domain-containing protein [Acidimicrobiia bacterium]|nr:type IV toxin-antitoxin system AbiEi family antitoxin domain-containing protein [Acidimicrobiia bacterium]
MDDQAIYSFAADNYGLVDRATLLIHGGSDEMIRRRLDKGAWRQIHAGVYQVGVAPLPWRGQLRAATLAAGPLALVSHRTAAQLWDLEGVTFGPVELTVPVGHLPAPEGVLLHRTRRRMEGTTVDGIPVTTAERSILDSAWYVPTPAVEQLYDSGIRKGLLTPRRMAECLDEFGTKGVRGRSKVIAVLDGRRDGKPLGSPAETLILRHMRLAGLEEPERQYVLVLPDGTVAILDFAWPRRVKAVEIDGLAAHSSARQLELDLIRQNLIFEVGWQLRRFAARTVSRHPKLVVAEIAQFLAS